MDSSTKNGWQVELEYPIKDRSGKPRANGITMVIDKGIGVRNLRDLLEIAGDYIDFLKFSFGTSLLYPSRILAEKIKLAIEYGLDVYPGGTLFEVFVSQNRLNEYLFRAKQLGFTAIEISNGTLDLSADLRREAINKASSLGFKVLTEVGKKDRHNPLSLTEMRAQIERDMADNVDRIIIEGRESGKGISIYKDDGSIDMSMVEGILMSVEGREDILIWEAPLKKQQVVFIRELGPSVNLGNIQVDEVLALETLRRGLRGDTFFFALDENRVIKQITDKESRVGA